MSKPKLCMLVKDEEHVIKRCLDSAMPYVDGVYIHDTGSKDKTIEAIRSHPIWTPNSEVVSVPWVGFAQNRSKLLEGARKTSCGLGYHLMHDADDTFDPPPEGWEWPELSADGYMLQLRSGGISWWRTVVFSAAKEWYFRGAWHSVATLANRGQTPQLEWPKIETNRDGARSTHGNQRARYIVQAGELHAEWLEKEDLRSLYYAGQSYRDAGEYWMAAKMYHLRSEKEGWEEEKWHATYMTGVMATWEDTRYDPEEMLLKAIDMRPQRMEPYVTLASHYRKKSLPGRARAFAQVAASTKEMPQGDILFMDKACYGGWRAIDEFSLALFGIGRITHALAMMEELQNRDDLPDRERKRVADNIMATRHKLPRRSE